VPAPNPTITEKRLPAQVGHPMNNPVNTPNVEAIGNLL